MKIYEVYDMLIEHHSASKCSNWVIDDIFTTCNFSNINIDMQSNAVIKGKLTIDLDIDSVNAISEPGTFEIILDKDGKVKDVVLVLSR